MLDRKIAKYPIIGMNTDDDDVTLSPGFFRRIRNMIPRSGGFSKAAGGQNVPGTVLKSNSSLPAGTNSVTASYEDKKNNRVFYFCSNSYGNHSIWYFSPATDTHTQVFVGSSLDPENITSVDSIDDILFWANGGEPRSIVVTDAVNGRYTNASFDLQTGIQKENPYKAPTAFRYTDVSVGVNNVCFDSFQFCYRIIYRDDSPSFFSPWSSLVPATDIPNINLLTSNVIRVSISPIASSILPVASKIQWAYMKNGDGRAFIFHEEDIDQYSGSYSVVFKNTEAATAVPDNELFNVNFVPQSTGNILVNNQRSIVTLDEIDSGFDEVGSSVLHVTPSTVTASKTHIPGASYTYGIVYFDSRMRTNGVVASVNVAFPQVYGTLNSGVAFNQALKAQWSITGSPPSWAAYYCIVRKKNSTISSVFQIPALALFYKYDGDTIGAGEIVDDGKIYYNSKASVPSISSYSGTITWKLPINIPVGLDESYRVRLCPNIGQTKTEQIQSISGDKIVTGNFGITNWSSTLPDRCYPIIQFEKISTQGAEEFFECSQVYQVTGGAHSTVSGSIDGDSFLVYFDGFFFEASEGGTLSYSYSGAGGTNPPAQGYPSATILSQSPTTASVTRDLTTTERHTVRYYDVVEGRVRPVSFVGGGGFGNPLNIREDSEGFKIVDAFFNTTSTKRTFTMDYTKICSDNGRIWVEIRNKGPRNESTTLSISDKYVLESTVNGLSRFQNLFTLSSRSPVRKLVNIGASGIFLAIHEHTVTSLAPYSGDRFAPTSDGSQIQDSLNTRSIIAYENELRGGYGTVYPNSVVEHNGVVYFFDPYKGEVCRYAANGVTPIGSIYKMKTYFTEKGNIFVDTSGRDVIGGFDPKLNMYILTFVSDNEEEQDTIAFIDRQGEERWFSTYDFVPERYAKINNKLYSFSSGMWEHSASGTYNNFYGSQYSSEISGIINAEPSQEKILHSIYTESSSPWGFPSITSYRAGRDNQETLLVESAFTRRGNEFSADVKRNKYTPGLSIGQALARGDLMIGRNFSFTATNSDDELAELYFVNFIYNHSAGRH